MFVAGDITVILFSAIALPIFMNFRFIGGADRVLL